MPTACCKRKPRAVLAVFLLLLPGGCPSLARSGAPRQAPQRSYGDPDSLASFPAPSAQPSPTIVSALRDPQRIDDLGAVGTAGRPMLRFGAFTKILVELHCVKGGTLSHQGASHLIDTLGTITSKPVEVLFMDPMEPKGSDWSIAEIQDLAEARGRPSIEPNVSLKVMCLDHGLEESSLALGASVGATVMAIFPDRTRAVSIDPGGIEAATLVHELGHLLGLIDLQLDSPRRREHPDHPGHSKNPASVMYWAIDRVDVASELGTLPPRDFDKDDLADLADMASGRL